jgi:hypothetical protein
MTKKDLGSCAGIWIDSLALQADAYHMLGDSLALLIGLYRCELEYLVLGFGFGGLIVADAPL